VGEAEGWEKDGGLMGVVSQRAAPYCGARQGRNPDRLGAKLQAVLGDPAGSYSGIERSSPTGDPLQVIGLAVLVEGLRP
jgi:hypothetical protein